MPRGLPRDLRGAIQVLRNNEDLDEMEKALDASSLLYVGEEEETGTKSGVHRVETEVADEKQESKSDSRRT